MYESITKNRQTPATLRAMVARAFGDARVPDEARAAVGGGTGGGTGEGATAAAGRKDGSEDGGRDGAWYEELGPGWFNVTYRLTLRDGRQVVLKIAPPPDVEVMTYEHGMMRNEVAALTLLHGRTAAPVPALLHHDGSHELCDADWFFMEYAEGENLKLVRDRLPAARYEAYREQTGAANRALNEIKGTRFGPLAGGARDGAGPRDGAGWREVFTGILEDVLRDGERRSVDIGMDYDAVRALIAAHAAGLDEVTEPAFVTWDLWDGNVLVRDGALSGLIDHERAMFGDPVMEVGFAGCELDGMGDPAAFLRGYGRGPLTAGERVRRRLYNLHLMLIMTIETVYRGHTDPAAQYDAARAGLAATVRAFDRVTP